MQAVRLHEYGEAQNLVYETIAPPTPEAGEVLIEVKAAGINPLDAKIRSGRMVKIFPFSLPMILGLDLAGVVAAVGADVTDLQVGQDVYGIATMARSGAYAEYAIAKAEQIAPKPINLSYTQAACVPVVAMTAWQALFEVGQLSPGQKILIHGASGNVGMFAVQFAKAKGAYVIGTASAHNLDFVTSLGADEVIDYRATRFEEVVSDVDMVLDSVAGETRERSWGVLKSGGILVSLITSAPIDQEIAAKFGVRAVGMSMTPKAARLREITSVFETSHIKIIINQVLPFSEAIQAHQLIEQGNIRGKIILHN